MLNGEVSISYTSSALPAGEAWGGGPRERVRGVVSFFLY